MCVYMGVGPCMGVFSRMPSCTEDMKASSVENICAMYGITEFFPDDQALSIGIAGQDVLVCQLFKCQGYFWILWGPIYHRHNVYIAIQGQ